MTHESIEHLEEMNNADWGETPKWLVEATILGHFIPPSALELISEVKTRTGNHLVVDRSRGAVGFDQLEEPLKLRKHIESAEIRYHLNRAEDFKLVYDPTFKSQERHKPLAIHRLTIDGSADLILGMANGNG